ncbi:MAG: hypothetical protein H0V85_05960 [Thermoleophilaceae bacterium]|nr:hypothetical protein [Thermoleophilaceae bacterium]
MKLDKSCALFFGTKIDSKLREALSQCKPGERKYFDGSSEEFLRILEVDEEKWLGKVINPGPSVTEVDDIQRNIVSILRRVAPNGRVSAQSIKIFTLQGAKAAEDIKPDEADELEPSQSGPYIDMRF